MGEEKIYIYSYGKLPVKSRNEITRDDDFYYDCTVYADESGLSQDYDIYCNYDGNCVLVPSL